MQIQPKNLSQAFMTVVGLVLLVMALVLNHKHPHNQGIATLPRNSIYQLELSSLQQAKDMSVASAKLITQRKNTSDNSTAYSPTAPTVTATPTIIADASLCASIDEQSFVSAQKTYADSYDTYGSSSSGNKDSDSYQVYVNSLSKAYANYQTAVKSSGCTPTQAAPTPKPE